MTTTLEKVARAMWESVEDIPWKHAVEPAKRLTYMEARAAIQALMEPSEQIMGAGMNARLMLTDDELEYMPIWRAMLQAILDEQKETA